MPRINSVRRGHINPSEISDGNVLMDTEQPNIYQFSKFRLVCDTSITVMTGDTGTAPRMNSSIPKAKMFRTLQAAQNRGFSQKPTHTRLADLERRRTVDRYRNYCNWKRQFQAGVVKMRIIYIYIFSVFLILISCAHTEIHQIKISPADKR